MASGERTHRSVPQLQPVPVRHNLFDTLLAGTEAIADDLKTTTRLKRAESKAGNAFRRNRSATLLSLAGRCGIAVLIALVSVNWTSQSANAQSAPSAESPKPSRTIRASGKTVYRWQIGDAQASLLEGDCVIALGTKHLRAERILIVSDGPRGRVRNRLVLEQQGTTENSAPRSGVWMSDRDPVIDASLFKGEPDQRPFLMEYLPPDAIKSHGSADMPSATAADPHVVPANRSDISSVQPAQFQETIPVPTPDSGVTGLQLDDGSRPPLTFDDGAEDAGTTFIFGGGSKRVDIDPRGSSTDPILSSSFRPETNETVLLARGGVTLTISDVALQLSDGGVTNLGTITLSADRVVAWVPSLGDMITGRADQSDAEGELYLEGDVVFRRGQDVIYADSMYYNVSRETGMVLDAEAITSVPEYQGIVRLKAEVLQQISRGNYRAFDAAVTSSRMGVPRYWLQSEQLDFFERTRTVFDPRAGRYVADPDPFVRSRNNFVFLGGLPIFYWPQFTTSLERPVFYLKGLRIRNDNNFGTQVLLDWDMFQLLGIENVPKGVDWELSTDYLSDRGPAIGTNLDYNLPGFLGYAGRTRGVFDGWLISDDGVDRLGQGRLELEPEEDIRGRALLRHRQDLANDYEFIAQLGWLSDRNFLEQYIENEWDQDPDHVTEIRLRKYYHNQLFDLSANAQLNDFFQVTERLPSLDHWLLGASILGDRVTWQAHNHLSYSRLNVADAPEDPIQAANYFPLPGEVAANGVIASTDQELAINFNAGPFLIRPVGRFSASHYGEAADGDSLTRLVGQAGLQLNLPMVRIDPTIQSSILNMKGLAHKVDWNAEYWYADSNANLDEVPLYDPLDDNAQEQFRRRFIGDTFGGTLPSRFDPRTYAFRQGIQRNVTSASDSIADDLQQFRVGLNQRFQTKRGLPGRERIVDLLQFDVDTILFPDADRDNFGETLGPTTYDFRYHLGDRFSILSDGYIDFIDDGLRSISAGVRTSRPGVSDMYIGLLSLEGPISSTVLRTTVDYRLNEKWIFSGGTIYDFGEIGNVGQSFGLTTIRESFLIRFNINVDSGRDNVGFGFLIEPRFLPRQLGIIGNGMIPPPGIEGLE